MASRLILDDMPFVVVIPIGAAIFATSVAIHAMIGVICAAAFTNFDVIFAEVLAP